jgi:hypothetical protein
LSDPERRIRDDRQRRRGAAEARGQDGDVFPCEFSSRALNLPGWVDDGDGTPLQSETLKYLFLLFSDGDTIPLSSE